MTPTAGVAARGDECRSSATSPRPRRSTCSSETHAKARSYYLFLTVHGLDHWGRYLDEFAPVDGKWLITHRREMTDAAFAGGWGAGAAAAGGTTRSSTSPGRSSF